MSRAREVRFQKEKDKEYKKTAVFGAITRPTLAQERLNTKLIHKRLASLRTALPQPQLLATEIAPSAQYPLTTPTFPPLEMFTGVSTISKHSKVFGIWLFLLTLILGLGQDITMAEAALTSNENFGRKKSKRDSSQESDTFKPANFQTSSMPSPVGTMQEFSTLFTQVTESQLPPQTINVDSVNLFSSLKTTCFRVTPEVIAHFCTKETSPADVSRITTIIMDVMKIDPIFDKGISIIFNYLPNFKITFVKKEELPREVNSSANVVKGVFAASTHMLYLTQEADHLDFIHESRHMLMNAVQIAKAHAQTDSMINYYPITKAEANKVMRLIQEGISNVRHIENLLKQKNPLSHEDKKYLAKLKKLVSDDPHASRYFLDDFFDFTEQSFKILFENKKGKVVYHSQFLYGPVKVIDYKKKSTGIYTVHSKLDDPLWGMINALDAIQNTMKGYSKDSQIYEMDAYLFQKIPMPLLRELFPKYLEYTQNLVTTTQFSNGIHTSLMSPYESMCLHDFEAERFLLQPERFFKISDADKMIKILDAFANDVTKLDQCERAAQLLIKKRVKIGEANLALGNIYYLRGNHVAASHCYTIAFQAKTLVATVEQWLQYAESLMAIGSYHDAENIASTVLLTHSDEVLVWTKKYFEQIIEKVKEGQATTMRPRIGG
jgi:hypothetical protein